MAEDVSRAEATAVTDSGLFVRNATGLVRGMSQRASIALNFIPGHPTQTLSAVLFYFLTVFAGANMYLALLLVVPMTLSFSYAFGLLTQMIPRSGGDYMLVSRVIHPLVGVISSFCMSMAGFLSNAFFGLAFAIFAVSPSCIAIGKIGGYSGLTEWGQDIAASRWWQFFLGAAMITVSSLIHLCGWRWMIRFLLGCFWFVTGGMVVTVLVLLIRGQDTFARASTHSRARAGTGHDRPCRQGRRRPLAELLVHADPGARRGARHRLDLLLLVVVRGRRAAPGEHAQDRQQHGARRPSRPRRRGDLRHVHPERHG